MPLADRDNLPRSTRASGRRDAAAMVGPGHPAHDSGAAWNLLAGDRLGARIDAEIQHRHPPPSCRLVQQAPTFSDAIAAVRRVLWSPPSFSMCRLGSESIEIPVTLLNRFVETLCLAA